MSRLVGPALAAAVFHAVVLAAYVAAFHGDLSALVCVARERLGRTPYELIGIGFDRNGYDGQFYYAIARSPWRRQDFGIDAPAIRQARILYPALSWLLSGGDAQRLLWAMPLVNLLAIAALAALGAAAARDYGLSPWWGVLLPFAVNAGMPALRNLTDVLSTLSVAALLMAWLRRWPWWAAALGATAALFSREQNLAVVLLVFLFAFRSAELNRNTKTRKYENTKEERAEGSTSNHARFLLPPYGPFSCFRTFVFSCFYLDRRWIMGLLAALLSWSLWLGILRLFYGEWPLLPAGGNLGPPLAGMFYRWTHLAVESRSFALFHVLCMATLTLQLGLALCLLWTPSDRLIRLTALAGAGLALLGGWSLYGDNWSYPRVFAWLPLGVWLACVQLRWRWPLVALSTPALIPLAVLVRVWTGTAS